MIIIKVNFEHLRFYNLTDNLMVADIFHCTNNHSSIVIIYLL